MVLSRVKMFGSRSNPKDIHPSQVECLFRRTPGKDFYQWIHSVKITGVRIYIHLKGKLTLNAFQFSPPLNLNWRFSTNFQWWGVELTKKISTSWQSNFFAKSNSILCAPGSSWFSPTNTTDFLPSAWALSAKAWNDQNCWYQLSLDYHYFHYRRTTRLVVEIL